VKLWYLVPRFSFCLWIMASGKFTKSYWCFLWVMNSLRVKFPFISFVAFCSLFFFLFFFFSAGIWTQGLHLEPLHQPFFVMGFFEIGSCKLFAWAGFKLQSTSWIARITCMSHPPQALFFSLLMLIVSDLQFSPLFKNHVVYSTGLKQLIRHQVS
jgi:hypothetical protein